MDGKIDEIRILLERAKVRDSIERPKRCEVLSGWPVGDHSVTFFGASA